MCSKLYNKPTDAHLYLNYNSCHPQHNKVSIPISQFVRLKRIHTFEEDYEESAKQLESHFLKRGYPHKIIKSGRKKTESYSDTEEKSKDEKNLLIFTTTFNPRRINIQQILDKYKLVLTEHPETKFLVEEKKWLISYRKPRNLKDILTSAKMENKIEYTGTKPCGKLNAQPANIGSKQHTSQVTQLAIITP